jgi:hypothetical protein
MAGNPLSGFKGSVIFQKISDAGRASLLFPAAVRKTGKLSRRPLTRTDAVDTLKRRLKQAGLSPH